MSKAEEVTYSYVKGSGWIPERGDLIIRDGYRIELFNRRPLPGERYYADSPGYPYHNSVRNIRSLSKDPNYLGLSYEYYLEVDRHNKSDDWTWIAVKITKL